MKYAFLKMNEKRYEKRYESDAQRERGASLEKLLSAHRAALLSNLQFNNTDTPLLRVNRELVHTHTYTEAGRQRGVEISKRGCQSFFFFLLWSLNEL